MGKSGRSGHSGHDTGTGCMACNGRTAGKTGGRGGETPAEPQLGIALPGPKTVRREPHPPELKFRHSSHPAFALV